jgi:hypothetical protein
LARRSGDTWALFSYFIFFFFIFYLEYVKKSAQVPPLKIKPVMEWFYLWAPGRHLGGAFKTPKETPRKSRNGNDFEREALLRMTEIYRNRQEEFEYIKRVATEERPICTWCTRLLKTPPPYNTFRCEANLDWQETEGMNRKQCPSFELKEAILNRDTRPHVHTPQAEQMLLDFGA